MACLRFSDRCGVCNGNGTTCVVIRGHHNYWQFGYTDIVTIPAGARNIDIRVDMKNMTFLGTDHRGITKLPQCKF